MAYAEAVLEKDQRREIAGSRVRRNIFGSIIGGLTGLVTEEQLRIEQDREKELEKKIKYALEQEVSIDGQLDTLNKGMQGFEAAVESQFKEVMLEMRNEDRYRTRQERTCPWGMGYRNFLTSFLYIGHYVY